jgi:hypothetical protein
LGAITTDQIPIFILLILPGFIATKAFDLFVPGGNREASRQVLDALAYGTLNLGFWYVPLDRYVVPHRDNLPVFYAFTVVMLVVSPVVLAWLAGTVLMHRKARGLVRHPTPTAWDHFFGSGRRVWVLATLKSGMLIGGWYGWNSFASSYPDRDLYLEQVWKVDGTGRFGARQDGTAGAIVSMDECQFIEFFVERSDHAETDATAAS